MKYIKFTLLLVAILAASTIFSRISAGIFPDNFIAKSIYKSIMAGIVFALIIKQGFWSKRTFSIKDWLFLGLSIVLVVLSFDYLSSKLSGGELNIPDRQILFFLLSCLSVGLFEELLFRKFTFDFILESNKDKPKPLLKAIIISSVIFAMAHSTNFFKPEVFSLSVINQIVFAFGIGCLFQCLYVRFNNLILVITLHGLVNFLGGYRSHLISSKIIDNESTYTFDEFWPTFINLVIFDLIIISLAFLMVRTKSESTENPYIAN